MAGQNKSLQLLPVCDLLFAVIYYLSIILYILTGSSESVPHRVEVCVRSSWSLEVRWAEHKNRTSSEQRYQIQIRRGEDLIITQVCETGVLLLCTHRSTYTHTLSHTHVQTHTPYTNDDDEDDDVFTE